MHVCISAENVIGTDYNRILKKLELFFFRLRNFIARLRFYEIATFYVKKIGMTPVIEASAVFFRIFC